MKTALDIDFGKLRKEMVEKAIFARGVRCELVLNAMRNVAREAFLPAQLREFAYEDVPLPIEEGQTISQPYIVAFMTEALVLRGGEKVLEIGAGSGYAAAILSEIAAAPKSSAPASEVIAPASKAATTSRPSTGQIQTIPGYTLSASGRSANHREFVAAQRFSLIRSSDSLSNVRKAR
jgi:protein-L-isoaspartate O-methyltransferase